VFVLKEENISDIMFSKLVLLVVAVGIMVQFLPLLLYPTELKSFSVEDIFSLSSGMTIVVTGANSGLGYATVDHLVQAGTAEVVIMACRSMERCERAREEILSTSNASKTRVVPIPLDLASRESIVAATDRIQKLVLFEREEGVAPEPIHALINNAGVMGAWKSREYIENVETHVWVNHVGHALLTHLLWPNLVAGSARIVSISSAAALTPFDASEGWFPPIEEKDEQPDEVAWWKHVYDTFDGIRYYAISKRANLKFATELHDRYYPLVSSVGSHPGYSRTELIARWNFPLIPEVFKKLLQTNRLGSMDPKEGSLTQLRAALDREGVPSGSYVGPTLLTIGKPVVVGNLADSVRHHWPFSRDQSQALWDKTLSVLGISEFGKR
jgi:NAD(P)-dependent dehydrogenase (short-subunit alcohol dehydrogenase family)